MVLIRSVPEGSMALDRPDDDMDGGGEYGELTIELAASLAAHKAPVTPDERDELRALLEAMNMPTDPIERLNVQA
jgi:hypothetical protein